MSRDELRANAATQEDMRRAVTEVFTSVLDLKPHVAMWIGELTGEILTSLQDQISDLRADLEEANREIETLRADLEEAKLDTTKLNDRITELED